MSTPARLRWQRFRQTYTHVVGQPFTLDGWECGGLVVHRSLVGGTEWTVSHGASGFGFYGSFQNKQKAMAVVEAALKVQDWQEMLSVAATFRTVWQQCVDTFGLGS